MKVSDAAMYILVFMVATNAWCTMLYSAGISGEIPQPSWNQTELEDVLDVNGTIGSWNWEVEFYDLAFGIIGYINVILGIVNGFPTLLSQSGVPDFIKDPLSIVWYLIFFTTVMVSWIAGRDQ